jgi:hypothetical protein
MLVLLVANLSGNILHIDPGRDQRKPVVGLLQSLN